MPLTARLDGVDLVAPLLTDDEWTTARAARPRPQLTCGAEAVAKTSKLGTRFFAHLTRPATDDHKAETAEHLLVKARLIQLAMAAGWRARAEAAGPNREWIADVLAEHDGRRVAFEVQLAGQPNAEYRRRQNRYARAGIECIWLVRRYDPAVHAGVPAVPLRRDDAVGLEHKTESAPLSALLTAVLNGPLRWRPPTVGNHVAYAEWTLQECGRCHQTNTLHRLTTTSTAECRHCASTAPAGPPYVANTYPRAALAAAGLTIPSAIPDGTRWRCAGCHRKLPLDPAVWIERQTAPGITGDHAIAAHWCAPAAALTNPALLLRYLRDDHPSAATGRAARPDGTKLLTRTHALANSWAAHAAGARRDYTRLLDEPTSSALAPAARTSDPHKRTHAMDSYAVAHQVTAEQLLELFPIALEHGECICGECVEIRRAYSPAQRNLLWPWRARGSAARWT